MQKVSGPPMGALIVKGLMFLLLLLDNVAGLCHLMATDISYYGVIYCQVILMRHPLVALTLNKNSLNTKTSALAVH